MVSSRISLQFFTVCSSFPPRALCLSPSRGRNCDLWCTFSHGARQVWKWVTWAGRGTDPLPTSNAHLVRSGGNLFWCYDEWLKWKNLSWVARTNEWSCTDTYIVIYTNREAGGQWVWCVPGWPAGVETPLGNQPPCLHLTSTLSPWNRGDIPSIQQLKELMHDGVGLKTCPSLGADNCLLWLMGARALFVVKYIVIPVYKSIIILYTDKSWKSFLHGERLTFQQLK